MIDKETDKTQVLWNYVDGKMYNQGQHAGLLRSLTWGRHGAWDSMEAFIEIVRRLQTRIDNLEKELEDRTYIKYE